jgi:hypothetical protein
VPPSDAPRPADARQVLIQFQTLPMFDGTLPMFDGADPTDDEEA